MKKLLLCLLIPLCINLSAEEKKPETAWYNDTGSITEGTRYVFGSVILPPGFMRSLAPDGKTDETKDPFSNTPSKSGTPKKHSASIPPSRLPLCLPRAAIYYDISDFLRNHGIAIKAPEWALLSTSHPHGDKLYFCTTWQNADIIEQFITPLWHPGPRSIVLQTRLISVENQGLKNASWSMARITKSPYIVHARSGFISRSGERSSIDFNSQTLTNSKKFESEYEFTLGENKVYYDCLLALHFKLPGDSPIEINQLTAIIGSIGTPFMMNLGTHGKDQRNYLLIMQTRVLQGPPPPYQYTILKKLEKIEGPYAVRTKKNKHPSSPAPPLQTLTYRSSPSLLNNLRNALADPEKEHILAPTRVNPAPKTTPHHPDDRVFDISPQLRTLGLALSKNESVYFNATQHLLTIRSYKHTHDTILSTFRAIDPHPLMINLNAHLVSVDIKGLETPVWTSQEIKSRNPEQLRTFALTGISGMKSMGGELIHKSTTTDKKTGIETTHTSYEFEAEHTLSECKKFIDYRINLESNISKNLKLQINTAFTISDGEPLIIELGHPASATRTHLLILNADVTLTDGTFYRDRFKPIKK